MTEPGWHYAFGGTSHGPVSREAVLQAVQAAGIDRATVLVWKAGMSSWVPLPGEPAFSPSGSVVDRLNTFSEDELLALPFINLEGARRVVLERVRCEGFRTLDEVGALLNLEPHQLARIAKAASEPAGRG